MRGWVEVCSEVNNNECSKDMIHVVHIKAYQSIVNIHRSGLKMKVTEQ